MTEKQLISIDAAVNDGQLNLNRVLEKFALTYRGFEIQPVQYETMIKWNVVGKDGDTKAYYLNSTADATRKIDMWLKENMSFEPFIGWVERGGTYRKVRFNSLSKSLDKVNYTDFEKEKHYGSSDRHQMYLTDKVFQNSETNEALIDSIHNKLDMIHSLQSEIRALEKKLEVSKRLLVYKEKRNQ